MERSIVSRRVREAATRRRASASRYALLSPAGVWTARTAVTRIVKLT
jgi:hypothetical protein